MPAASNRWVVELHYLSKTPQQHQQKYALSERRQSVTVVEQKGIKMAAGQPWVTDDYFTDDYSKLLSLPVERTGHKELGEPEFEQNIRSAVLDKQPIKEENTEPCGVLNNRNKSGILHTRKRQKTYFIFLRGKESVVVFPQLPSQAVPLSTKRDIPSVDSTWPLSGNRCNQ